MALVLDTGPILALLDADDPHHRRCVDLIESKDEDLLIPSPVLVEIDYWALKLLGQKVWESFLADIAAGAYRLEHLDEADLVRVGELERRYSNLDLGLVDAA